MNSSLVSSKRSRTSFPRSALSAPGVTEQMEWIQKQGYPMAVVSTSAKPRVVASLKKTNLMREFLDTSTLPKWHMLTNSPRLLQG